MLGSQLSSPQSTSQITAFRNFVIVSIDIVFVVFLFFRFITHIGIITSIIIIIIIITTRIIREILRRIS